MDSVGRALFFRPGVSEDVGLRGIECVSIHLNARGFTGEIDHHDIEAARTIVQAMPGEVVNRHLCNAVLLQSSDCGGAAAELAAGSRLHFDEHRHLAIASDDVNFSKASSVATRKNCVPAARQFRAREIFSKFSE